MSGLTQKQEAFCLAFIESGNASEAYRRAYNAARMKPETVSQAACRLLADSNVAARVAALRQEVSTSAVMTAQQALQEATKLATFNAKRLFKPDGTLRQPHELDDATAGCITGFEFETVNGKQRVRKYRFSERNSALEKLFRHHGLFDKHNRQIADPLRKLVEAISGNTIGVTTDARANLEDD